MAVGESRSELLSWLNSEFGLEYKKVELCGTGAAYCHIMDSIYGGVPMAKVKFGLQVSDYDARNNMKILQALFNRHRITRQIDTERLIRCRLQDNLELLQWLKRHWVENKNTSATYDAPARRRGTAASVQGERAASGASRRTTMNNLGSTNVSAVASRNGSRVSSTGSGATNSLYVPKQRAVSAATSVSSASNLPHLRGAESRVSTAELTRDLEERTQQWQLTQDELVECKVMMESLESERNFYFNKLRDIEVLSKRIQDQYALASSIGENVRLLGVLDVMVQIDDILYATEKGFELQDTADSDSF